MNKDHEREAMHRRAQKAEGAVQSALFEVRLLKETLSNRNQAFWLANKVLDDIERSLMRSEQEQQS